MRRQRNGQARASFFYPPDRAGRAYFEDSYLARYLGYTLVEGGDLTIRGANVCLKTLGGLLPVDVVLRRTADDESDPLELRADSVSGVAGLVEAAQERTGRRGQYLGQRALGITGVDGLPTGDLQGVDLGEVEAPLGADVVVRAQRGLVLRRVSFQRDSGAAGSPAARVKVPVDAGIAGRVRSGNTFLQVVRQTALGLCGAGRGSVR